MTDVFCNNCGHRNPVDANFCSSCGASLALGSEDTTVTFQPVEGGLEGAEEELSVAVPELAPGTGMLLVKRGPNAGSRYGLESSVTRAGRHPESDIFLDDITVSRRHAEFLRSGEGYVVKDVGSLNGTYLNRERIEQAPLSAGDEVQIGKFKLVFIVSSPEG
ncbi:MAG: FHA domain-containing protein [Actinomycetota bacterium]|nr:FHA domain-containing protein [Actinomycetota bacterium]